MRAIGSSSSLALLAILCLSGCATTERIGTRRGPLLRTLTPEEQVTQLPPRLEIDAGGVARLSEVSRVCTRTTAEYQKVEVERTTQSLSTFGVVGVVGAAGGAGALLYSATLPEGSEAQAGIVAAGLVAIAVGGALWLTDDGGESFDRETPLGTEREESVNCVEAAPVAVRGTLPWTVTLGSKSRSGTTSESGALALPELLVAMLEELATMESVLRSLVRGSAIRYSVQLGPPPPVSQDMPTSMLPAEFWERLVQRYDQQLAGPTRSRWENCRLIAATAREAFECLWSR